jgi:hypothetical protein
MMNKTYSIDFVESFPPLLRCLYSVSSVDRPLQPGGPNPKPDYLLLLDVFSKRLRIFLPSLGEFRITSYPTFNI